jgi:hypothetical protein
MRTTMVLTLRRESRLSTAMERLRAGVLDCRPGSTRDSFDAHSSHVVACVDRTPVGMVRVTPANRSVLAWWADGVWSLPTGEGVVELNRGVVADEWRRHGVYRLLMLAVMAGLSEETVKIATAAIEPEFVGRRFLESLGFRAVGAAMALRDEPRSLTFAVPILTPVDAERRDRWRTLLAGWRDKLAGDGIEVAGLEDLAVAPLATKRPPSLVPELASPLA